MRRALGFLIGWIARVWLMSLRTRVVASPALDASSPSGWVLVFWHGSQFPLYAWRRRRPTVALVSLSSDGDILDGAMGVLGLDVARGSSSRGGARGLRMLVGALRGGRDVAIAVDGPRGPAKRARPGASAAARSGRALIVPMAAACVSSWRLRSWDGFELPVPFSRVVITLGDPLVASDRPDPGRVAAAIDVAEHRARQALAAFEPVAQT